MSKQAEKNMRHFFFFFFFLRHFLQKRQDDSEFRAKTIGTHIQGEELGPFPGTGAIAPAGFQNWTSDYMCQAAHPSLYRSVHCSYPILVSPQYLGCAEGRYICLFRSRSSLYPKPCSRCGMQGIVPLPDQMTRTWNWTCC